MSHRSRRGRPSDPVSQVQRLAGDELAKRRLAVVIATLTGERTIDEACAELGISVTRFFELKQTVLESALDGLTPRAAGRPARPVTTTTREEELEARIRELEIDLQCAYVRTEIALVMPRLLKPAKKKRRTCATVRPASGIGSTTSNG